MPIFLQGTLSTQLPPMRLVSRASQEYAGAAPSVVAMSVGAIVSMSGYRRQAASATGAAAAIGRAWRPSCLAPRAARRTTNQTSAQAHAHQARCPNQRTSRSIVSSMSW